VHGAIGEAHTRHTHFEEALVLKKIQMTQTLDLRVVHRMLTGNCAISKPAARDEVEFFRDDQVLNFRRLIDRQLEHRNGHVLLHQTPGLGFNFDEKMIKRYGIWLEIR
jgi:hypothetical protein